MKKIVISLLLFVAPVVFATPQQELSRRFEKLDSFTALFTQTVTSPEGEIISNGEGKLSVKRPNLFRWETQKPDENVLVSDGKTMWYYDPFIEQVSAMWLDDAMSQTPFVLLTSNDLKEWENYKITQKDNVFTLLPKHNANMGKFTLKVFPDGKLTEFVVIEQDKQISRFQFSEIKNTSLDPSIFLFSVPKGVELDDQRQ